MNLQRTRTVGSWLTVILLAALVCNGAFVEGILSAHGPEALDAGARTQDAREYPGYRDVSPLVLLDINLYVPMYNQCDSGWGSDDMETCDKTICQAGCALTSTAMVFKYYGCNTDPGTLNTCLGNSACPIYWGTAATSCSCGKASFVGKYTYSVSLLVSALEDGRPRLWKW